MISIEDFEHLNAFGENQETKQHFIDARVLNIKRNEALLKYWEEGRD